MTMTYGQRLRNALGAVPILPLIGVYDVFSAGIAARHFDALFISGFGFAASHHGPPDRGYIAWSELVALVQRVRTILPGLEQSRVSLKLCNQLPGGNVASRERA